MAKTKGVKKNSARKEIRKLDREFSNDLKNINQSILRNDLGKSTKKFDKNLRKLDKEVDREFQPAERWVVERRKFFRKLGFLIALILVLLVLSLILMKIA